MTLYRDVYCCCNLMTFYDWREFVISVLGTTTHSYVSDRLQVYTPSRTHRSASDTLSFQIPCIRLSTVGSQAFLVFGPSAWNDLPLPLRQKPSLDSFRCNLKTFLFPKL